MLARDLASKSVSVFKQDPNLVAAIDKLYGRNELDDLHSEVLLPDRRMDFLEVQQILNKSLLEKETPPWSLGIVATAKGLIAGPIKLHFKDGTCIDCFGSGGTLIPQDVDGIKEFKTTAKYILVVEKDAVFQKLLDEGALVRLGPLIILTGKGYPDVCTRQLLCRLVAELRLRALALVDADPHGYEIFLTYKYGSLAQSHLSQSLACSSLQLLGARHNDVMTLAPKEARLPLTTLDKGKINSLVKRPYLNTTAGSAIRKDLQDMLRSGVKAEIEAMCPNVSALCDTYLPSKIIQGVYLG
ncbi:unnamed protein product, partial [Iphiclides podalirius]